MYWTSSHEATEKAKRADDVKVGARGVLSIPSSHSGAGRVEEPHFSEASLAPATGRDIQAAEKQKADQDQLALRTGQTGNLHHTGAPIKLHSYILFLSISMSFSAKKE